MNSFGAKRDADSDNTPDSGEQDAVLRYLRDPSRELPCDRPYWKRRIVHERDVELRAEVLEFLHAATEPRPDPRSPSDNARHSAAPNQTVVQGRRSQMQRQCSTVTQTQQPALGT